MAHSAPPTMFHQAAFIRAVAIPVCLVWGLVEFMARQVDGNRNDALYWAARTAIEDGVLDQIEAELLAAAVATGLDPREANWTVASARTKASA